MIEIVQSDNSEKNSVLRKISREVPILEIKKDKYQKIISDMKKALSTQDDGVALAAPQIGISLRIFVISKKVFETAPCTGCRL